MSNALQDALTAILGPVEVHRQEAMRILLLDIETYPALTWQWTLWDKFTPIDRVVREGGVLSIASKWYAEPETGFRALWTEGGRDGMIDWIHGRLSEADAVVTYNGAKFDLPWLSDLFLTTGRKPVAPFASIDLYWTMKQFRSLSNKLDFWTRRLELGSKVGHYGFQLWVDAMPVELGGNGDPEAQALMETYNIGDVGGTLEPLYDEVLPYIKSHPHVGLYSEYDGNQCQNCGHTVLERNGHARTPLGVYQRFQCARCGRWHRGRARVHGVDARGV